MHKALILLATTVALAGCAAGDVERSAEAVEAPPKWRVGYTWGLMTEERLRAAAGATAQTCLVGAAPGLEAAAAQPTPAGFDLVDTTTGARMLWMEIEKDRSYPASWTLNLNWDEAIGAETPVAYLRSVDKTLKGETPC